MVDKSSKHKSALSEKEGIESPKSLSQKVAEKLKISRKQSLDPKELISAIFEGNKTALSRAITLVESTAPKHQEVAKEIIEGCLPKANQSVRIGITGVPGVGKSTFIERLGLLLTSQGRKVAVLAVDPSSSISGGSILGDKTRMEELVKDTNAFIRPSASGNSLGGVARKTRESIVLCEAAGYDTIIIETVGVGQSETAVHSMTDFFLLLKLAGAGDELQGMKRGIIEMADAIVINKADGENRKAAEMAKVAFNRALHLYPPKENGWIPKTITCSAIENEGVDVVWTMITEGIELAKKDHFFQEKRIAQHKFWLLQTIESQLKSEFFDHPKIKEALEKQMALLEKEQTTPFQAAQDLLRLKR